MREIIDDLDLRRRALFDEAVIKVAELRKIAQEKAKDKAKENEAKENEAKENEAKENEAKEDAAKEDAAKEEDNKPDAKQKELEDYLDDEQKKEYARWKNLARYQPPVIDYLKAQVLTAEKRYAEALAALEKVTAAHMVRPGLFLQTADLYQRLKRWRDAAEVYKKALAIDPDNAHAHLGMCRMALRRRRYPEAAQLALDALQRIYHYPLAHYLLGLALTGMKEYGRAATAFGAAISFNPNFPEAHMRLAALLEQHLGDPATASEHRRLARQMRRRKNTRRAPVSAAERVELATAPTQPAQSPEASPREIPPLDHSLVVVTGLPRSGTSMFMQMLAAGGIEILTDGLREPDEDNPRGYLEFEPVKNLLKDNSWLLNGRGKAVKIVAPLLPALPPGLPCRVIFTERDLDEVLDSQDRMLVRRKQPLTSTPERRKMLRDEYARTVIRIQALLRHRPGTQLLTLKYRETVADPRAAAKRISAFLGGHLDITKMVASVDPTLHRNRA